jgi:hypothetical protein
MVSFTTVLFIYDFIKNIRNFYLDYRLSDVNLNIESFGKSRREGNLAYFAVIFPKLSKITGRLT